ncbi:hypothetical protein Taro_007792, partial [Colocasia esculenta]|nr:hypothetical protein [Colocasia esculenta]
NKRTDDLKETNEEHMDDSNAHLSVTNELLAEEAVKQTSDNQESSKQDELSEETKKACMEGIKELTIPEQNKKTDDLKEINEEHKDESNAHLTVIDELVEETLREADTMQKESGSNRKQVIHETMNNHVAVETKTLPWRSSFHSLFKGGDHVFIDAQKHRLAKEEGQDTSLSHWFHAQVCGGNGVCFKTRFLLGFIEENIHNPVPLSNFSFYSG